MGYWFSAPAIGNALTWYLGPTRVAARGKIKSSGSNKMPELAGTVVIPHCSHPPSVSSATVYCLYQHHQRPCLNYAPLPYPKYLNGHILKCLISSFSSFSASTRSFRGRPLPLGAGALDLGLGATTGVWCRTSWLSTSSSCCLEQGAHVQPYPRLGFASKGGETQPMWKKFLHRSHWTASGL